MRAFITLILGLWSIIGLAQSGSLDPAFNPNENDSVGYGASGYCHLIKRLTDGRMVITNAGRYNDRSVPTLVFIKPNGVLDDMTMSMDAPDGAVWCVTESADGSLVLGGAFTMVGSQARNRLARLHPDGSLDLLFATGIGANDGVHKVVQCADGKFIIVGSFTEFDGVPRNKIARLNADGTLDPTFDPGSGCNDNIQELVLQPDGNVLIAGNFTSYNGVSVGHLARIDTTGGLDPTFATEGATDNIACILLEADGRMMIGGPFSNVQGVYGRGVARLESDGTLDPTFNAASGTYDEVNVILRTDGGQYLVGGFFYSFASEPYRGIVRLDNDGSVDTSFGPTLGAGLNIGRVSSMTLVPGGGIRAVVWNLMPLEGQYRTGLVALTADGTFDPAFGTPTGFDATPGDVLVQPDGRIVVVGDIQGYDGAHRRGLIRLMPDGAADPSFGTGSGISPYWFSSGALAMQTNGQLIVAGGFSYYNGVERRGVVRLQSNGAIDMSFDPDYGSDLGVKCVAIQSNGKILVGGDFNWFDYNGIAGIARLNTNGAVDASFDPGVGVDGTVYCIAVQPDGKILLAGSIYMVDSVLRRMVARLDPNGSLDTSFEVAGGPSWGTIRSMVCLPDSRILIAGEFTLQGSNMTYNNIARLMPDGSLDETFFAGEGSDGTVHEILVQPDGRIVVVGLFSNFHGQTAGGISRLLPDGDLDPSFSAGTGALPWGNDDRGSISEIALQGNNLIVTGGFIEFDGYPRHRIARLFNEFTTTVSSTADHQFFAYPNPTEGNITMNITGPASIVVHDLEGRMVLTKRINGVQRPVIDLSGQDGGIYMVKVNDGTQQHTMRVVKQ